MRPASESTQPRRPRSRFARISSVALGLLLTAVASSSAVSEELQLTWNDNSTNEAGFEIERSDDGISFKVLHVCDPDTAQFVDSSIEPGVLYSYRVRAFNDYGHSSYTNVAQALVEGSSNSAPTVEAGPDIAISLSSSSHTLAGVVSDDGLPSSSVSTTWSQDSGPADATFDNPRSVTSTVSLTQVGTYVLRLTADDGELSSSDTVTVTVLSDSSPNAAPTVSSMGSKTLEDGATVGPVSFSINDDKTPASELALTVSSSDETLVPIDNITLGGSGQNRSLKVATVAGKAGSCVVKVHVSDGVHTSTGTLSLTITLNAAPTVSEVANQWVMLGGNFDPTPFTVGDRETSSVNLTLSASSSNTDLVPTAGIRFGGSGANRTVTVVPVADRVGAATITISVSDGTKTSSTSFGVAVGTSTQRLDLVGFRIEGGLAVAEVKNGPHEDLKLMKMLSLGSSELIPVEDAIVTVGTKTTTLVDPNPVTGPVWYRVCATAIETAKNPQIVDSVNGGASTSLTLDTSSVANGNLMIAAIISRGMDQVPPTPAGWTLVEAYDAGTSSSQANGRVYSRIKQSDDATFQWEFEKPAYAVGFLMQVNGSFDVADSNHSSGRSLASVTVPEDGVAVAIVAKVDGDGTNASIAPSGYVAIADSAAEGRRTAYAVAWADLGGKTTGDLVYESETDQSDDVVTFHLAIGK